MVRASADTRAEPRIDHVAVGQIEVRNGFWYKIHGGDAETPEYRVSVRAAPAITDFLATYHFRPYVPVPTRLAGSVN